MKLRFYKIANVIWLISFLVGGYATALIGIGPNTVDFGPIVICYIFFALSYGLGLTGLKKEKEHKRDFLPSLIAGLIYFVLCFIYTIKVIISLSYLGPVNVLFPIVALVFSILQLLATFLAVVKAEGSLFVKDQETKTNLISYVRGSSKELLYFITYLLLLFVIGYMTFSSGQMVYNTFSRSREYEYYYGYTYLYQKYSAFVLSAIGLIGVIAGIVSYIWVAREKNNSKAGPVFTVISLISLVAMLGARIPAMLGGIAIFIILVVGSRLAQKDNDVIILKGKPLIVLIVVCAFLFAGYITNEVLVILNNKRYVVNGASNIPFICYLMPNGVFNYIYNYYGYGMMDYFDLTTTILSASSPSYLLIPAVIFAALMIKKIADKKLIKCILLITSFSLLFLGVVSLLNMIGNIEVNQRYPDEYYANILAYNVPLISADFIISIATIICYVLIRKQQPLQVTEESVINNQQQIDSGKKLAVFNAIGVLLLPVTIVLFIMFLPILFDSFNSVVTAFNMPSNDRIAIASYLLNTSYTWLLLLCMIASTFYLFFVIAYYEKKRKLVNILEYALCGLAIVFFLFIAIMIGISNDSDNTQFGTLAPLPICIYSIWLIGIIFLNNKTFVLNCTEKVRNYIGQRKNKAAIRKERRQEKAIEAKRRKEEEELRRQEELERQRQLALELEKRRQEEELRRQKEEEERRRNNELHANQQTVMVTPSSDDKIRQIKELLQLREEGAITEEEFLTLKKEIIGGGKNDEEK